MHHPAIWPTVIQHSTKFRKNEQGPEHSEERISMAITRERFEQGLTYDEYKAQMTRNQERFEQNEQTVQISSADIAFFASLPQLHVLVLAEDWCGDVIANLPILGQLAKQTNKLNIRVFLRDQNLDIMDQYLKDGQFRAIPVFVFFDEDFRELGFWIERPASVSEMQAAAIKQLYASDPAFADVAPGTDFGALPENARNRMMQFFASFREQHRVFSDSEVVRELRTLLAKKLNLGGSAASTHQPSPTIDLNAPSKKLAKVSITYCSECGYESQTLALVSSLMHTFLGDLAGIELIPWHDGAFDVAINGEIVHSMYRDGGFPDHATIINAVRERMN
jgi:selT/selW/selH-like putative selenoprotein